MPKLLSIVRLIRILTLVGLSSYALAGAEPLTQMACRVEIRSKDADDKTPPLRTLYLTNYWLYEDGKSETRSIVENDVSYSVGYYSTLNKVEVWPFMKRDHTHLNISG